MNILKDFLNLWCTPLSNERHPSWKEDAVSNNYNFLILQIMKKFLMILMAAATMMFAGMSSASAQGPGGFDFDPEAMVKMRVDHMKETLKINKDQEAKLTALFKKQNEEMAKMFEGGGMPDMSKMQENMKKQDEEIQKILTKEQYKIYSDEQKRMMEQFGGGGF